MNTTITEEPVQNAAEGVCAEAATYTERGAEFVRHNPISTILGAVAIGFAIGWLIPRHQPTWRERFIDEPTDKVRGWIGSAVDQTSEALDNCYGRTAAAADNAVGAVRKGLRKLRFW